MQVQNFNNQRNLSKLPSPQTFKGPDAPQPDEPKEKYTALDALVTVGKNAATYGLFYYAGGGTMGGTMAFGAGWHGTTAAMDMGEFAYKSAKAEGAGRFATGAITTTGVLAGAAVGAGFGALNGWATFTLATAMGGGIPGALAAGAALGAGEAAYKYLSQK